MPDDESPLFRVRTVSVFTPIPFEGTEEWRDRCSQLALFLDTAKNTIQIAGIEVQTVRISTRVLNCPTLTPQEAQSTGPMMESIAIEAGIRFLNLGSIQREAFLEGDTLSNLASSMKYTSFSVSWQANWGLHQALRIAAQLLKMDSSSTFRFGISFNCGPEIPYFPASYAGNELCFSVGTENSEMLTHACQLANDEEKNTNRCPVKRLHDSVRCVFNQKLRPLEKVCCDIERETRVKYRGIDPSIAPDLRGEAHDMSNCMLIPSWQDDHDSEAARELWGAGTPSVIDAITSALKKLDVSSVGYKGVMLPVLENESLAKATGRGQLSVKQLLLYSTLCGVGLDTVPIPGGMDGEDEREKRALEFKIAATILDMNAISKRQNKPLTIRFLPVKNAKPGDVVDLKSPYLTNGYVMAL
eukprot:jgi/Picsp_1/414/NSC_00412-R1_protein of hypothetical function duf711